MKKRSRKKLRRRRNAAPGPIVPRRRGRMRLHLPRRGAPPDWKTTLAAIAGGAGGAALGGLVVNQQILSPESVGLGMMGIGSATAYFAEGNTRVLGNSIAAAGAGQLALALMARKAIETGHPPPAFSAPRQPAPAPPAPQIGHGPTTTPQPPTPRRSAADGATVIEMFRDAALELDQIEEDEWRFGSRDAHDGEADVYDLDLDAA